MGTSACWDIIEIFPTKHSDVYHVPASKLTLGQRWQWLAYMVAVAYATLGQRWLQVTL